MKLGMTSLTLKNEPVENVVKYAKETGIEGIEWGICDNHVILGDESSHIKIKESCRKNGIEIFSLGSYCKMTDREECDKVLNTAVSLTAPVIRVWAGWQSPSDCGEDYISAVVENTVYMAKKAEKHNIRLGFEYHHNTLTETPDSAVDLIKRINLPNVGLYWQPIGEYSKEENLSARNKVLEYLVGNMHIHNYTKKDGYMLIEEIPENIRSYYSDIKDNDYNLMIEFVKDGTVENLKKDAAFLRSIIK